jgi:hypothetical protein
MTTDATALSLTDAEIARARQIWQEYQKTHDVSAKRGWAAGIDPKTNEVWLGKDLVDIYDQRIKLGLSSPLFVERVGARTYLRKGSRR